MIGKKTKGFKFGKYEIRPVFKIHKNYVFLLTVHEGNAYWGAHEYHGDPLVPVGVLAELFWREQDKQVDAFIKEAKEKEPREFMELTVDDQTKLLKP
jgi:hypothetical protein